MKGRFYMVRIVTDSTCDLSSELVKENEIEVVPLNVYFGEKAFKDGLEITSKDFYKMLKEEKEHPKTSQPTPEDFVKTYQNVLEKDDEIISIHISSKLSGTYQSALIAQKDLNNQKITVLDSKHACGSLGLIVLECAKMAKRGESKESIVKFAQTLIKNTKIYFIVDTLEYLRKGGRIGRASELIGTLLNVKPVLFLDDGIVTTFDKARGVNKAFSRIINAMDDYKKENEGKKISYGFIWGDNQKIMNKFLEKLPDEYEQKDNLITEIGSVIGAHTGPGAFGIVMSVLD